MLNQEQERLVRVGDVQLCVETFGEPGGEPFLLIGNTMLTWPAAVCERLPGFVIRYDLRDTGRSTLVDPDKPAYTLRDLVADAAGLLDALGVPRAHVAGFGPGGWIAQLLALDHPDRVASLTLIGTRPTAPGRSDPDLPEHAPELMRHMRSAAEPDWTDRAAVVEAMTDAARVLAGPGPFDEAAAREHVGRIFDRSVAPDGVDPRAVHRSNQTGTAFASLRSGRRWRERLGEIRAPALVIHGADDPFFPLGNGEALAREIPGAELVVLPGAGQVLQAADWDQVVRAMTQAAPGTTSPDS